MYLSELIFDNKLTRLLTFDASTIFLDISKSLSHSFLFNTDLTKLLNFVIISSSVKGDSGYPLAILELLLNCFPFLSFKVTSHA